MPFDTMDQERVLRQTPEQMGQVQQKLVHDLGRALHDPRFTEDHREEEAARLRKEAEAELDQLAVKAKQASEEISAWINEKSVESADVQSQLLAETKKAKAWDRARIRLDHGDDVDALIAEAKVNKDLATLRGLAEEFPVWTRGTEVAPAKVRAVLDAVGRAIAEVTPGSPGVAARMRYQLAEQNEEVRRALTDGRNHITRLADDPVRTLRRAARMADVEENSMGVSITNGVFESHVGRRSGGDFSGRTV